MAGTANDERAAAAVAADTRWGRWLTYFPFVAGGGLAALYAVGALMRTTQLMGADLQVRDTLPLIPLPQLLAVGIGTAVKALALLPGLLLLAGMMLWPDLRTPEGRRRLRGSPVALASIDRSRRRQRVRDRGDYVALTAMLLGLVALLSISLPAGEAATIVGTFAFLLAVGRLMVVLGVERPVPRPWNFLLTTAFISLTVTIAASFIYPSPLPTVALERHGRPPLKGKLVADTGSSWYVADGKNHFVTVPSDEVVEVRVRSLEPGHSKSAAELLGVPISLYP